MEETKMSVYTGEGALSVVDEGDVGELSDPRPPERPAGEEFWNFEPHLVSAWLRASSEDDLDVLVGRANSDQTDATVRLDLLEQELLRRRELDAAVRRHPAGMTHQRVVSALGTTTIGLSNARPDYFPDNAA